MSEPRYPTVIQRALALAAALFGLLTIFAGTRVLTGADPGYVVFLPLLIYNTAMGFVYVAAGVIAWHHLHCSKQVAAAVFLLNLVVLAAVALLHSKGQGVALDSVRAMMLRTGVWLALFLGLAWLSRKKI